MSNLKRMVGSISKVVVLIGLALFATFFVCESAFASGLIRDDVNDNGQINVVDSQIVYDMTNGVWGSDTSYEKLRAALKDKTPSTVWDFKTLMYVADANEDGKITSLDSRVIQVDTHRINPSKLNPSTADFTFEAPTATAGGKIAYDKTVKEAKITTTKTGMGDLTVKYKSETATEWTTDKPVAVGTYKVCVDVADNGENYNAATDIADDAWTFTIEKRQLEISTNDPTTIAARDYEAGNTAAPATIGTVVGIAANDNVTVSIESASYADDTPGVDKDVTVKYKLSDDASAINYIAPADQTLKGTINKLNPAATDFTFTAPAASAAGQIIYDGTAKAASVTTTKTGMGTLTVKYKESEADTWTADAPKDAGTYAVCVDVADGTIYSSATAITANTWTFTINALTDSNWMGRVSDNAYLNEINMPGSHDSGTYYMKATSALYSSLDVSPYSQCQNLNISGQLSAGVRVFDLRLGANEGENLCLYHGNSGTGSIECACYEDSEKSTQLSFDKVCEYIATFLQDHPTETVCIMVDQEYNCRSADAFLSKVKAKIDSLENEGILYTGSTMPLLKDVRGKMVLISEKETIGKGVYITVPSGAGEKEFSASGLTLTYENTYGNGADDKQVKVNSYLASAENRTAEQSKANVMFTSSYTMTDVPISQVMTLKLPVIATVSNVINPILKSYTWNKNKAYGWVLSDFTSSDLSKKVYETNF